MKNNNQLNSIKLGLRTQTSNNQALALMVFQIHARWCKQKLSDTIDLCFKDIESYKKNIHRLIPTMDTRNKLLEMFNDKTLGKTQEDIFTVIKSITLKGEFWLSKSGEMVDWHYNYAPDWIAKSMPSEFVFNFDKAENSYLRELLGNVNTQWVAFYETQNNIHQMLPIIYKAFDRYNMENLKRLLKILSKEPSKRIKSDNDKLLHFKKLVQTTENLSKIELEGLSDDTLKLYVHQYKEIAQAKIEKAKQVFTKIYGDIPFQDLVKEKDANKKEKSPTYSHRILASLKRWYNDILNDKDIEETIRIYAKPFQNKAFDKYWDENYKGNNRNELPSELIELVKRFCNHNNCGENNKYKLVYKYHPDKSDTSRYSIYGFRHNYVYHASDPKKWVVFRLNNQNSLIEKYNLTETFNFFDHCRKVGLIKSETFIITSTMKLAIKKMYDTHDTVFNPSMFTSTYSNKRKPIFVVVDNDRRFLSKEKVYPYDFVSIDLGINKAMTIYKYKFNDNFDFPSYNESDVEYIKMDTDLILDIVKLEREKKKAFRKLKAICQPKGGKLLKRNKPLEVAHRRLSARLDDKNKQFARTMGKHIMGLAPLIVLGDFNPSKMRSSSKGNSMQSGVNVQAKAKLTHKMASSVCNFLKRYIELQVTKYSCYGKFHNFVLQNESHTSQTCPLCNTREPANRKGEKFTTNCCSGVVLDADGVGAYNIGRAWVSSQMRAKIERKKVKGSKTRLQTLFPKFNYNSVIEINQQKNINLPIDKEEKIG